MADDFELGPGVLHVPAWEAWWEMEWPPGSGQVVPCHVVSVETVEVTVP
jgi:hypothetical protein